MNSHESEKLDTVNEVIKKLRVFWLVRVNRWLQKRENIHHFVEVCVVRYRHADSRGTTCTCTLAEIVDTFKIIPNILISNQ